MTRKVSPLDKRKAKNNILDRVARLERIVANNQRKNVKAGNLSSISTNMGAVRTGDIVLGSNDPRVKNFTGAAFLDPPLTVNNVKYSLVGMNNGKLEFGASSDDGTILAANGDVTLSADGVKVLGDNANLSFVNDNNIAFIYWNDDEFTIQRYEKTADDLIDNGDFEDGDTWWTKDNGTIESDAGYLGTWGGHGAFTGTIYAGTVRSCFHKNVTWSGSGTTHLALTGKLRYASSSSLVSAALRLHFTDSSGTLVGSYNYLLTPSTDFVKKHAVYEIPSGAVTANIYLVLYNANTTTDVTGSFEAYFDEIELLPVKTYTAITFNNLGYIFMHGDVVPRGEFIQNEFATASSSLTCTSSYQDVPGLTLSLGVGTWLIEATLDTRINDTSSGDVLYKLDNAGTAITPYAYMRNDGGAAAATIVQRWRVTLTSAATLKIQAKQTLGSTASTVQVHSTFSAIMLGY